MFIGKTDRHLDWGQYYTKERWRDNVESSLVEFATLMYREYSWKIFVQFGI